LLLPSFVFYLVFALIPIANTAQLSLFKWDGFSDEMPFVGSQNYTYLFTDSTFWQALWRNVEWTVMTLVFAVGFALLLAAILARLPRGRAFFRVTFFCQTSSRLPSSASSGASSTIRWPGHSTWSCARSVWAGLRVCGSGIQRRFCRRSTSPTAGTTTASTW
jgi:hypothetical protein